MEKATFAGGCFWCTEAVQVESVIIDPKIQKLISQFNEDVKEEYKN